MLGVFPMKKLLLAGACLIFATDAFALKMQTQNQHQHLLDTCLAETCIVLSPIKMLTAPLIYSNCKWSIMPTILSLISKCSIIWETVLLSIERNNTMEKLIGMRETAL